MTLLNFTLQILFKEQNTFLLLHLPTLHIISIGIEFSSVASHHIKNWEKWHVSLFISSIGCCLYLNDSCPLSPWPLCWLYSEEVYVRWLVPPIWCLPGLFFIPFFKGHSCDISKGNIQSSFCSRVMITFDIFSPVWCLNIIFTFCNCLHC